MTGNDIHPILVECFPYVSKFAETETGSMPEFELHRCFWSNETHWMELNINLFGKPMFSIRGNKPEDRGVLLFSVPVLSEIHFNALMIYLKS